MNVSLSDADIRNQAPDLNILRYNELQNITPHELLSKIPLVILYQKTNDTGHWVLLDRTPEGIEFFDPYGFKPDEEFNFLSYKQPHYIAKLLYCLHLTKYKINYNQYQFQQKTLGINTCGRHVLIRHEFNNKTLDEYKSSIDKLANQLNVSPDQLVVQLTS